MDREIGTLVVVVLKARNLRDKHTITKQDVYVQATLNKVVKKTATDVKGGQHPVWDEELRFPIVKTANDDTRKLEVVIYSKEPRQDELVGKGSLDVSETVKTGEFDDWVPLFLEDGQQRGDIFLEMTYYANAPPPQRRPSKWKPADRLKRGPNGVVGTTANKHDALPPLPEEAAALVPGPASPPKIPSSLLPGGGASKHTSPKSDVNLLPPEYPLHTKAPRETSPPPPTRNGRQSIDNIPAHLRPGGGAARPTQSPHSSVTGVPEVPGPRGSTLESIPPYLQHGTPAPYPAPVESVPPYLQPAASAPQHPLPGRTPIPEPHIPKAEYGVPAQPQPYGHDYAPAPYPPQSLYAGYSQQGSGPHLPPAHFVGGISSPPPPQQPPPQRCPGYGSPPRAPYLPLGSPSRESYPPYGPPPRQDYPPYGGAPPPHRASQAYPVSVYGGYPPSAPHPPERGLDLPDPYLEKRYQTPLPLPDGSLGRATSPQRSHPLQAQAPVPQPTPVPKPAQAQETPKPKPQPKGQSREEQDRILALRLEEEEEERKRRLREQEERDMELARQLDLELNLEGEGGAGGGASAPATATATATAAAGGRDMPGGW
ncbi:hypothetical protein DICSQDRAFT_178204 [Dichomitus squalens LYAD-421 SS1]|uniref:uncharacterized protein n=1 Tax=Dichomitus squalens (strain LYAD-421) TaxID=732165 RepID=UPI0004414212|nr:uncharacterized protein DICSQDRAFT_178204 [Dichomitus squalens LYAD-421 SS1]EJF64557.1 hypothetical protein DICSQDRAFT_178204 [Dichomitus squalens LYAD-421 SS1]